MKEWLSTRGAKLGVAMTCGGLLAMVLAAAAVPALAQSVTQVGNGNQACVQTAIQAEVGKVQISQYGGNVNIQNIIAQECNINVAQVEEAVASASAAAAPAAVQYQYAAPEVQYSAPTALRPDCDVPDPPPVCDGDDDGDEPPPPPPQPPRNDNSANAIDLGSVTYLKEAFTDGNSNLATMELGEPRPQDPTKDCGIFGVSNSVWYKVTPTYGEEFLSGRGKIQLSTEGSSFDTALALYEGSSLTSLRQVACSNDNNGPNRTDRLSAEVNPGQTYYIQLLGTGGARSGDFRLKASQCTPPGCLRVATFNVGQSHVMARYPDEVHRTKLLEHWGRYLLSRADVVLLQEVRNEHWVDRMSWGSGLPYWYIGPGPACHIIDNAIVSRYPLYNQSRYVIPPSWVNRECGGIPNSSEILEAWVDINGSPHRFFTTHWDSGKSRWEVTEARTESAEISRDRITRNNTVAFYGGDLNECRPSSAALCGGSAAQGTSVGLLMTVTNDPLTELLSRYGSGTSRVYNCDPAPIDDVFYRNSTFADPSGPVYETVEYTSDCRNGSPSDHPFVRVAFYRER